VGVLAVLRVHLGINEGKEVRRMVPRKDMRKDDATNFRLLGAALLVFALAASLLSCGKKEKTKVETEVVRPVKLMTVASGKEALIRSLPGRVRASLRVDLAFQIEGTLIEVPVKEGQSVRKGNLLARLDPRDYEVALRDAVGRLEQARARLKGMRVARPEDIQRLTAVVEKARALVRLATVEYDRLDRVRKADPGAVAQSHLDRALERQAMAQADLAAAEQELSIAQAGARAEEIEAKEAEIRSLEAEVDAAKLKLSYTELRAPFSGIVSSRSVDNFQEVRAKQTVFTLDDLSVVEVLVEVPESLMAPVRSPGTNVVYAEFEPAPGKRYPLTLKEYATRGDPKTLTYQVTFRMDQPKERINILPGMTANVMAEPKKSAVLPIVIPAVAVFSEQGGSPHVWVVKPEAMTVHLRKVKTGDMVAADGIEIVEGLERGETIAVSGVSQLREGVKVRKLEQ
jgi:multidrug efflux system membrane fusion protein